MKTLLEKLKPEVKEIFDVEAKKYPNIVKNIMASFKEVYWVGNLQLTTVIDIAAVDGLKEYLGNSYDDMYSLSGLNEMFNKN